MLSHFQHFHEALQKREEEGTLRNLRPKFDGIDFYSNDYLGLARNKDLQKLLVQNVSENPQLLSGSTGSRLISGNSSLLIETEEYIAKEHQYKSALLFSSGYNANLALFSTLPTRHDIIIVDEQIHRSVHDACKMSHAKKIKFRHNNPEHLEEILKKQSGHCYVAIESLYSMDGDIAPLQEIAKITEKYNASLIVDEAHAFGVFGYGLIDALQLQNNVLATVITYGKALGTHGAAIVTNQLIKNYLINFASPFIYTTSAHDFLWMSIQKGYEFLQANSQFPVELQKNIKVFRDQHLQSPSSENSPIQAIIVPDNHQLKAVKEALLENGFLTYAVFSPTVKEGTERLRICIHSFNTEEEIINLIKIIRSFI
ncbi:aminotransferase class I/II-fold pyridoxal phosphate-dependent enzyme [Chryseobacterium gwangjuense]|uniref:aminotransferase class I/II-fold pyridoxal phosphate-dependent enzyme n=1 Tax=Chryseobacterium gwangjuense TaxID=1069980 RepID=UPI001E552278|nr:aminotransferase class I/II-fold pyridoxal phosphate-dependent enzyme [Chryseobacterium gwangjuense]MCE3074468.1 aminotransferase class I/II-fold pyridoxal phosphate-dependent enzyme [Chryseobacterium gwangjuense]